MEFSEEDYDIRNVPKFLGDPFPVLVPAVNDSYNEYSGITLPEISKPLGIHLGWNLRHQNIGGEGQIIGTIGATIVSTEPLPKKDDYLSNIKEAFNALKIEGFILEYDREFIYSEASKHYDAIKKLFK